MKRCRISWFSLVLVLLGCTSTEPGAGTAGTRETNGSDPQVPGVPGDDNPSTAPGDDPTSPSDTPGNDPSNPGSDPGKSGGDPSKPSDTPGNDPSNPGDTPSNDPSKPGDEPTDPGTPVSVPESPRLQEERATIRAALSQVADLTAPDLIERHAVPFQQAPEYDLETVAGLSTIQSSPLPLEDAELAELAKKGFVISGSRVMPSFLMGYAQLYAADLPVYISADSILYSVHDSYDEILKTLELEVLRHELGLLLSGMRERLATWPESEARADADVYLTVAASLLQGQLLTTEAGGDPALVSGLYESALAAEGQRYVTLFGVVREEDFSQFEPRGHYAGLPDLEQYFRAMIWLGRTDFRMLEAQQDGTRLFRRRQLEAALLLRELIDASLRPRFERIDGVVTAFVGEHDYMQLGELDRLLEDLSVSSLAELASVDDATIVEVLEAKGYGAQRISSHIMRNGMREGTLPLSASFALLGQRYAIDSHVFSNVVYDRVANGTVKRMMPNPLDVAFAVFGNDQAASLLSPELEQYPYATELASMRVLADAHPESFWTGNLYNLWLSSIRALSPNAAAISEPSSGLFPTARSEAWGRRLLSTQLASWAELRHDTILYVKQSYTGGVTCEFPDAYVEPYPEFFASVRQYAERGKELVAGLGLTPTGALEAVSTYFEDLAMVAGRLGEMAEYQRTGAAFTPEMMEFINDAVTVEEVCGGGFLSNLGWYGRLFFDPNGALEYDPIVADVHTQPTDEYGNLVGRVLHVGTGVPRVMTVVAENCSGPRAYVGLVSSYMEKVTQEFQRFTDEEWANLLVTEPPPDPAWLSPLVTR